MNKFINEKAAGDYLGISPKTLASWRFKGRGPRFFKFQTAVRYAQEQLDEFIEAGRSNRGAS
jgi:hypothetical protein